VHDRDQDGGLPDCSPDCLGIDNSLSVDFNARHFNAFCLKLAAGLKNSRMFDRARNYVNGTVSEPSSNTKDGQIIRFGTAAREHYFAGGHT